MEYVAGGIMARKGRSNRSLMCVFVCDAGGLACCSNVMWITSYAGGFNPVSSGGISGDFYDRFVMETLLGARCCVVADAFWRLHCSSVVFHWQRTSGSGAPPLTFPRSFLTRQIRISFLFIISNRIDLIFFKNNLTNLISSNYLI